MSIDLNKLNISLDKFNAESSGTYNIGHLKLSSDGKSVYRTNNHKTFTLFNNTKISSEEALAVKFAFCKALSKEGLDADQIAAVKEKLGISGGALSTLKAGNIKPLTAAEVREIIDVYAGQINRNRASAAREANIADVKALKTSKDLYNGVEMEEMADRAKTRDAINAGSLGKVMTGADKMVNSLLDILQFGEHGESIKGSSKAFAREIMTKLSNPGAFNNKTKSIVMTTAPVMFTLQENGNVVAKVALDNGNIFSMDTGLDRQGLADKAVDALNSTILPTQPSVESLRAERKKSADDEIMNSINEIETGEIEPERKAVAMSNEDLLKGFGLLFNALKKARGPAERKGLREANMEDAVKALQQALDKVRKLDNRNTQLINQVREVFYGNKDVDPDLLLKSISDVLNKKTVGPKDTILKNIESKIQDDLDENLNINAWLGEDVETKVDDVNVEG